MRPRLSAIVLAMLAITACSSAEPAATTIDPSTAAAEEFAFSARRALEATRWEGFEDDAVARMLIELCDDLSNSSDLDESVMAYVGQVDAPPGEAVDDQILAVVLAEGVVAVCPDVVTDAGVRAWEAADPEERYLVAVQAVAPQLDVELTGDDLVAAGAIVCEVLDAGGAPEEAVLAEFFYLFGISGVSIDDIASGEAGEREGLLAGGVLGGAASYLCPHHRDAVMSYLEDLAEANAE